MKRRRRIVIWVPYRHKRPILFTLVCLAVAIGLLAYEYPSMKTFQTWSLPLSGMVIVVDAGHGGPDGGAVSKSGIVEKNLTLAISRYLRDMLQQAGAVVYMTREEDKDLADSEGQGTRKRRDLTRRAGLAHDVKANLFVSVHMNSIPSSRWHGAQTFYDPDQHVGNGQLAWFIQDELKNGLGNTTREIGEAHDVFLLTRLVVPAVIVEAGFLSNPQEAELLNTTAYQQQVSELIYRGILRYASGEKLGST